ncbi:hypothetical protein G7Y89_g3244 [Cudoniella acicularis]|uniref:GP-PDE domain-containing protein n=1 Tax=Cudoniella acicularis TaxID=354080 RepID=A0A8H4RUR7_9HELO|nr:hypothetical protein G7Y89_g3244 [Cudoniella acicularis]
MATADPPPFLPQRRPPKPPLELGSRDDICFCHPGYHAYDLLLTLPRVDSTAVADATPAYGVHHRTALLACQIIAGNAFNNSRFTVDKAGRQPVQVPLDGVLTDSQYYFIVDGSDLYPIVPSFQDWQFPHDRIPDLWPPAAASSTATCGITNTNFAIDMAHLVPQKERTWYNDNKMTRYGAGLPDIDNRVNILPLRKDIHHCFDNRWFVIVPKITKVETGSATPSIQYITHIISRDATEIWPIYHNTLIESLHSSSRAYLFARFAWAILFRVKSFVIDGRPRHVIQIHKDEEGEIEYKAEYCTSMMLSSKYGGGGSQAATPKKRKSGLGSVADDEENPIGSSSEDSDISIEEMDDLWDVMDDWKGRGRQRRQDPSDETVPDDKVHLASDVEADLREALRKGTLEQQTAASRGGLSGEDSKRRVRAKEEGVYEEAKALAAATSEDSARIPKIQLRKTNSLPPCFAGETRIFANLGTLNTREAKAAVDMSTYLSKLPYNPYPETGIFIKISAIGATRSAGLIQFSILNDATNYPYLFTTTDICSVKLIFSVFKTVINSREESEHIGGAVALLTSLKEGLGLTRESLIRNYTVPILENLVHVEFGTDQIQLRSSGIESFLSMMALGFSYIEFIHISDAQTTRDSVSAVLTESIELSQLPSELRRSPRSRSRSLDLATDLKSQSLLERMKHTHEFRLKGFKGNIRGEHIHGPFTTLEEMLRTLPKSLGIDIELKYPMLWEAEDWKMDTYGVELNTFIDAILDKVYTFGGRRNIIFTSFSPKLRILLSHKQQQYPVLFLNQSNLFATGDVRPATSRKQCILQGGGTFLVS